MMGMQNMPLKTEQQPNAAEGIRRAYSARIEELKGYAVEDEIEVNPASERDFWEFVESLSNQKKAALFLCDSGNYRTIWKDGDGGHVGIQFFGNQTVECVIFKRRGNTDFVSRVAGHDTLQGVKRQIRAFDLAYLVGL